MALNTNAPYTPVVEYAMDTTATAAAFAVITGGGYDVNANIRSAIGIYGKQVDRGGLVAATVNFDCQEVKLAYLTGMMRSAPATTVSAKNFKFGNQDSEWVYTSCQPGGFRFGAHVDALPTCNLQYLALTPTQGVTGDTQEAVSGGLSDNWSDFDVTVGGADYGCQGFDVAVNTNAFGYTCLDSRATGSKRLPVAILLGHQTVTLTLDLAKQLAVATTSALTDDILNNLGVVIAGSGVTFTFTNLNTPPEGGTFMEALKAYRYTFTQHAWDSLAVSAT